MGEGECTEFLEWALPRMGMRPEGFRKPRGQVCQRIRDRLFELELSGGFDRYREYLEDHPDEWEELAFRCRVTISRFCRERSVWRDLAPRLGTLSRTRSGESLAAWSVGCASGEEPWTLRLFWDLEIAPTPPEGAPLQILATDFDPHLLERARRACYPESSLEEVPERWRQEAFDRRGEEHCLRRPFRHGIEWRRHDLRRDALPGPFDLVLCRYVVYIYFDQPARERATRRLAESIRPGGLLVVGGKEELPEASGELFEPVGASIYRRRETDSRL